ncbi:hypothetical protein [Actinomadura parmotrematis]|uniref:PKD domain-containing protein n=1 Tax=Actinomadura parmotrematis TaxID=2864039 RepID=A0ABS7FMI2_9ACTN|nr:hypothetical protein [Actinomadura parmotrematis]MBW8481435.1 hypothetical protein [Actinomadura parmotrematis]
MLTVLLTAAAALAVPVDAGCTRTNGWLCSVGASSPGHHQAAAPAPGSGGQARADAVPQIEVVPMCGPTGGADHCITLPEAPRTPTADVVQMARDAFYLPPPRPRTSPARRTFVRLPTYLWIEGAAWGERRASVAVDGQRVTMTGRPQRVQWDLGETTLTCDGPGTPYARGVVSSCAHAYQRASARPYTVTATVYYSVRWTCTGACDSPGGDLGPLGATGRVPLSVAEIQTTADGG